MANAIGTQSFFQKVGDGFQSTFKYSGKIISHTEQIDKVFKFVASVFKALDFLGVGAIFTSLKGITKALSVTSETIGATKVVNTVRDVANGSLFIREDLSKNGVLKFISKICFSVASVFTTTKWILDIAGLAKIAGHFIAKNAFRFIPGIGLFMDIPVMIGSLFNIVATSISLKKIDNKETVAIGSLGGIGNQILDAQDQPIVDKYGFNLRDDNASTFLDALGNPLLNANGQPLLDSAQALKDLMGRPILDRNGNQLYRKMKVVKGMTKAHLKKWQARKALFNELAKQNPSARKIDRLQRTYLTERTKTTSLQNGAAQKFNNLGLLGVNTQQFIAEKTKADHKVELYKLKNLTVTNERSKNILSIIGDIAKVILIGMAITASVLAIVAVTLPFPLTPFFIGFGLLAATMGLTKVILDYKAKSDKEKYSAIA